MNIEQYKVEMLFKTAQVVPQQTSPIPTDAPVTPDSTIVEPGVAPVEGEVTPEGLKPEDKAQQILDTERAPTTTREKEVYDDIVNLRKMLADMAWSVYQIKLTEKQLAELAEKVLAMSSDYISETTVTRVKDIARDLLMQEAMRRVRSHSNS